MWHAPENEQYAEEVYLAGERVGPGQYRQIGGRGRTIEIEQEGVLPASLDGRVACYTRAHSRWGETEALPAPA